MPELNPILVVCLAIGIVVVVNAVVIVGMTRAKATRQVEMAREAFKAARNPWAPEDEALQELSQRVKELPDPPSQDD
jgi:hypothetical protein